MWKRQMIILNFGDLELKGNRYNSKKQNRNMLNSFQWRNGKLLQTGG